MRKKVLFAAGGTGGHLFPAQALAEQLMEENGAIELLFAGASLSGNAYFDQKKFRFCDIASKTPLRGGFFNRVRSFGTLLRGVFASLRLLSKEKPDLVVGFGSFHAFPILCAAVLKRIPLVLFESNAIPGKVVRLFSKRAHFTGIYFSEAEKHLKGKTCDVQIPKKGLLSSIEKQTARAYWQLDPHLPTLLVFGGSQGSKRINEVLLDLLPRLKDPFQLIHFTGDEKMAGDISALCRSLSIPSYVKKFEPLMHNAWSAADVAICRAGAMTLSEVLQHEVPAILVPYPQASDQHQLRNAQYLQKQVQGAIHMEESSLNAESLYHALTPLLARESAQRESLQRGLAHFKQTQKKEDLGRLIKDLLHAQ